jgi:hypothetical protein
MTIIMHIHTQTKLLEEILHKDSRALSKHVRMTVQAPWFSKLTNLIRHIDHNSVEQPEDHEHSDRLRGGSHPNRGCN